ncbi:MAG: iron-containing alcohol dehydrogenase, partial [Paraprevotella sp.]|nr:iron-containing alcohol dehydrogenase [Paraprevotella sp.]
MEKQEIIISRDLADSLAQALDRQSYDRLFVLTDTTTHRLCRPLLGGMKGMDDARDIVIEPTDEHKDLHSLASVWTALQEGGATRHSLMINLGGGMVTDLGGFAASTFKRGIPYINIPTTLLSMVDA